MNIEKMCAIDSVILLTGQTGTGKTSLARLIHEKSIRRNDNFIEVNLAGISENLIESELFGHAKGSFTGAISSKQGFCDLINGGTLFLDEIGELSLNGQKKLLKLIEEKKYTPVGSLSEKSFEGTLVVATNKDLEKMVEIGEFREDLFFRLRHYAKQLPALSTYGNIKELIINFIGKEKEKQNKEDLFLSEETLTELMNYHWPGNFRELKNTVEYMVFMGENCLKTPSFLSLEKISDKNIYDEKSYHQALRIFEKKFLEKKLKDFGGKINLTSSEIGLNKVTFLSKLKKYHIDVNAMKNKEMVSLSGF